MLAGHGWLFLVTPVLIGSIEIYGVTNIRGQILPFDFCRNIRGQILPFDFCDSVTTFEVYALT